NTARYVGGVTGRIDMDERTDILREGLIEREKVPEYESYQPWARFCYLPSQAAAIDLYDAGMGGNDYALLGWALVPRQIFQSKPSMTSSGIEFSTKLTGSDATSIGQGVFVDGYYNLGWWGVILVGLAVGGILTWTSAIASIVYRHRAMLWLPIGLLGSFMAF